MKPTRSTKTALSRAAIYAALSTCPACAPPMSTAGSPAGPSESETFMRAEALATQGHCAEALPLLGELSAAFRETNPAAVTSVEALCVFYDDAELDRGEELARRVLQNEPTFGALLLAEMRAERCDFDAAIHWAYQGNGVDHRFPFYADMAIAQSALYHFLSGRPELARRNATQFLSDYPADWYESDRSLPPQGTHYNRESSNLAHRRMRGYMWLILASLDGATAIPEPERATVVNMTLPTDQPMRVVSSRYTQSEAGAMRRLLALWQASVGHRFGEMLGLSEAQRASIDEELRRLYSDSAPIAAECGGLQARMLTRAQQAFPELAASGRADGAALAAVDRDADGVAGEADRCPDQPEVLNGVDDADGCPDSAPVEIAERQIVIRERIQFKFDSAELDPKSTSILDEVAALIVKFPELRQVRVEGHTDRRGTAEHNLELSRQRAATVVAYLVARGVEASRLQSEGFGLTRPVAFGDDEASQSQNRRVEFLIETVDPTLRRSAAPVASAGTEGSCRALTETLVNQLPEIQQARRAVPAGALWTSIEGGAEGEPDLTLGVRHPDRFEPLFIVSTKGGNFEVTHYGEALALPPSSVASIEAACAATPAHGRAPAAAASSQPPPTHLPPHLALFGAEGIELGGARLYAGPVDAAALDDAQDLIWFASKGTLQVLDLRSASPTPVVIAEQLLSDAVTIQGFSEASFGMDFAETYVSVQLTKAPLIKVIGESSEPGGAAAPKMVGARWIAAQQGRKPAPPLPVVRLDEKARIRLPPGTAHCDEDSDCGRLKPFGTSPFRLVVTLYTCGDSCSTECVLYDPSTRRFAPLARDGAWGALGANTSRHGCSEAHVDARHEYYFAGDTVCTLGPTLSCTDVAAWHPFGWVRRPASAAEPAAVTEASNAGSR